MSPSHHINRIVALINTDALVYESVLLGLHVDVILKVFHPIDFAAYTLL